MFWAGAASTFVMGLGTAITVAAIATIAVGAKAFAKRFASDEISLGSVLVRGMEVGAAGLDSGLWRALAIGLHGE